MKRGNFGGSKLSTEEGDVAKRWQNTKASRF